MEFTNIKCLTKLDKYQMTDICFDTPYDVERTLAELIGNYCDYGDETIIGKSDESYEGATYDMQPFFNIDDCHDGESLWFTATVICEEYDEEHPYRDIECYYHPFFRLTDEQIQFIKDFVK